MPTAIIQKQKVEYDVCCRENMLNDLLRDKSLTYLGEGDVFAKEFDFNIHNTTKHFFKKKINKGNL